MRVLVISVHPDDETLGAGGTILKHKDKGDKIYWFIATSAFQPKYTQEFIGRQKRHVDRISNAYGFLSLHWPRFSTTCLDQIEIAEIIRSLREVIEKVKPHLIYTVGNYDVHTDHSIVFSALLTAIKSFDRDSIKRIISYEVISSTDIYPSSRSDFFVPNVYSDITSYIERKLEIMLILSDELHPYPLPRSPESIRALARYRGSTIGVAYAEAFNLVFEVL